jgi:hipA-like C-terminal domain./hipA-like N-terminal domain
MHLKSYLLYAPIGGEHQLTLAYDQLSTVLVFPEDMEEVALIFSRRKRKISK